jgi:hypothetical protein
LGLILESDPLSHHNVIREVRKFLSSIKIDWEHDLRYCMVAQVDITPIFLIKDVQRCLVTVDVASRDSVRLIVADCKRNSRSEPTPIPQIALDRMWAIRHVLHGWTLSEPVLHVTSEHAHVLLFTADNTGTMAQGQKNTRRPCLQGPHRKKWVEAEFTQLDKYNSYGMYIVPFHRYAVPSYGTAVHPIWNYSQKGCRSGILHNSSSD